MSGVVIERGAGAWRVVGPRGTIEVRVDRGVPLTVYSGMLTREFVAPFVEVLMEVTAAGPVETFNDATGIAAYDGEFRTALTDWFAKHRDRVPRTHVLAQGKLVAMGMTIASTLVGSGRVVAYSDRAKFDAAMASKRR